MDIFITNIPFHADRQTIETFLKPFNPKAVRLGNKKKRLGARHDGTAFVYFESEHDSRRLLGQASSLRLQGRPLRVNLARSAPRPQRRDYVFKSTFDVLDVRFGVWQHATKKEGLRFLPVGDLASFQATSAKFGAFAPGRCFRLDMQLKSATGVEAERSVEIPFRVLSSSFDNKFARFLDVSNLGVVHLYLTVDIPPYIYRLERDRHSFGESTADNAADRFVDGMLSRLIAELLSNNPDKDREVRTVDWSAGGFLGRCDTVRLSFSKQSLDGLVHLLEDMPGFKEIPIEYRSVTVMKPSDAILLKQPRVHGGAMATLRSYLRVNLDDFWVWFHLEMLLSRKTFYPEELLHDRAILKQLEDLVSEERQQLVVNVLLELDALASRWDPSDHRRQRPITRFKHVLRQLRRMPVQHPTPVQSSNNKTPNFHDILSVTITPTKIYVNSVCREQGNRVLRQYPNCQRHFLRVNVSDETGEKLMNKFDGYLYDILHRRVSNMLKKGIEIAGRKFEFLAFSSSQLRDHSFWMFASKGSTTPSSIRAWMGDFSKIRIPAKFAARMGQCFTTTYGTIDVPERNQYTIPDIQRTSLINDDDGNTQQRTYCFTDGIGKISLSLAEKALRAYLGPTAVDRDELPSAYQIRFRGCKGMLAVDPRLNGDQIHYRPSMEKFQTDQSNTLEIARTSRRLRRAYMNRQLIMILSHLGIRDATFLSLQSSYKDLIDSLMANAREAKEFLMISNSSEHAMVCAMEMLDAGFLQDKDPFLMGVLECVRCACLTELKHRSRFPAPKTYLFLGVVDEYGVLEENEIFVQTSAIVPRGKGQRFDDRERVKRQHTVLTGKAIVARNPAMHPGDIQIVKAVDKKELRHLKNCVVFSTKGARPLPNMLSDGDEFFVSFHEPLIPTRTSNPMDYEPAPPVILDRTPNIDDVADFIIKYMQNDRLGVISNMHLARADESENGPADPKCLKLARLASIAVDFVKTGVPADLHRDLLQFNYPHYMNSADKTKYHSKKLLGQLYDAVEPPNTRNGLLHYDDIEIGVDWGFLEDGYEEYVEDARFLKATYDRNLLDLMQKYRINTEAEFVTGQILTYRHIHGRKKWDVQVAIKTAFASVVRTFRQWILDRDTTPLAIAAGADGPSSGGAAATNVAPLPVVAVDTAVDEGLVEDAVEMDVSDVVVRRKASAWYFVTYDLGERREVWRLFEQGVESDEDEGGERGVVVGRTLMSFPWVVADVLLDIFEKRGGRM
ncbi:hypothetical protein HK102_011793 [Quaeritorhiza haematococci]|nr:hypothetical protein HK102_011793 [Quaeritorhiza haematococci]